MQLDVARRQHPLASEVVPRQDNRRSARPSPSRAIAGMRQPELEPHVAPRAANHAATAASARAAAELLFRVRQRPALLFASLPTHADAPASTRVHRTRSKPITRREPRFAPCGSRHPIARRRTRGCARDRHRHSSRLGIETYGIPRRSDRRDIPYFAVGSVRSVRQTPESGSAGGRLTSVSRVRITRGLRGRVREPPISTQHPAPT